VSNAAATNARWKAPAIASVATSAPASRAISPQPIARMSPNSITVASVAKLRECDTMMMPSESIPTNSSPMLVSYESRPFRCRSPIAALMPAALTAPPTMGGSPSSVAIATPGSMPWPMASPRKAIPRVTTHVPTTAHTPATRKPPSRARTMKSAAKGERSQDMSHDPTWI